MSKGERRTNTVVQIVFLIATFFIVSTPAGISPDYVVFLSVWGGMVIAYIVGHNWECIKDSGEKWRKRLSIACAVVLALSCIIFAIAFLKEIALPTIMILLIFIPSILSIYSVPCSK